MDMVSAMPLLWAMQIAPCPNVVSHLTNPISRIPWYLSMGLSNSSHDEEVPEPMSESAVSEELSPS